MHVKPCIINYLFSVQSFQVFLVRKKLFLFLFFFSYKSNLHKSWKHMKNQAHAFPYLLCTLVNCSSKMYSTFVFKLWVVFQVYMMLLSTSTEFGEIRYYFTLDLAKFSKIKTKELKSGQFFQSCWIVYPQGLCFVQKDICGL